MGPDDDFIFMAWGDNSLDGQLRCDVRASCAGEPRLSRRDDGER